LPSPAAYMYHWNSSGFLFTKQTQRQNQAKKAQGLVVDFMDLAHKLPADATNGSAQQDVRSMVGKLADFTIGGGSVAGLAASLVGNRGQNVTAAFVKTPPAGSSPADAEWLTAAAKFLETHLPEEVVETPGDGIVEHRSLAVCEQWQGIKGMPESEVYRMPGSKHAQETRDADAVLYIRRAVAKIAGVSPQATMITPYAVKSYPMPEKCYGRVPGDGCPQMEHPESCWKQAAHGTLQVDGQCCSDAVKIARCMGRRCFAHYLASKAKREPNSKLAVAVQGLRSICNSTLLPLIDDIDDIAFGPHRISLTHTSQSAVGSRCELLDPETEGGCPKYPDPELCNPKKAKLYPDGGCCQQAQRVVECTGVPCFTWLMHKLFKQIGDDLLLNAEIYRVNCNNTQFPRREAILKSGSISRIPDWLVWLIAFKLVGALVIGIICMIRKMKKSRYLRVHHVGMDTDLTDLPMGLLVQSDTFDPRDVQRGLNA